ncbi:MAG: helix-hairpin-helix domain-containing protein [Bacteroidetes bacterium]|nr:helix-hairpin-helix domain-containing protein [Bacteroidota bacterium]HET6245864.1 helix-hairpin-helix domain-containing protein [Bacteroidia bacterium]
MKQFFLDYFTFNKIERNGVFILCSIILLLLFFDTIVSLVIPHENINYAEFETEIDAFLEQKPKYSPYSKVNKQDVSSTSKNALNPAVFFMFDPNNTSEKQWQSLGLSQKQYSTLNNYLLKGGKFYKKEDLKKIYGISNAQYLLLEPFIRIENQQKQNDFFSNKEKPEMKNEELEKNDIPALLINLNKSDTSDLMKLQGIGPIYSLRIIKYRNALGGFRDINQLLEVYDFTKELVESIKPYIVIDTAAVKKININTCLASDLKRHPYINNWNITNSIVNYRDQHGSYKTIEDIKKSDLVNDELYLKLAPYLSIE